jgi:midasin
VTAKSLASESISGDLSAAKREKQQKALLVRKRKAWSDLLKELKRGGLSVNLKPDVLRQQSDQLWIREQPVISTASTQPISTVKMDQYFDRLHAALPQLRTSLSDHHSDVTTRELQRGVMLLESGFAFALEARSRYAYVPLFHLRLLTLVWTAGWQEPLRFMPNSISSRVACTPFPLQELSPSIFRCLTEYLTSGLSLAN